MSFVVVVALVENRSGCCEQTGWRSPQTDQYADAVRQRRETELSRLLPSEQQIRALAHQLQVLSTIISHRADRHKWATAKTLSRHRLIDKHWPRQVRCRLCVEFSPGDGENPAQPTRQTVSRGDGHRLPGQPGAMHRRCGWWPLSRLADAEGEILEEQQRVAVKQAGELADTALADPRSVPADWELNDQSTAFSRRLQTTDERGSGNRSPAEALADIPG